MLGGWWWRWRRFATHRADFWHTNSVNTVSDQDRLRIHENTFRIKKTKSQHFCVTAIKCVSLSEIACSQVEPVCVSLCVTRCLPLRERQHNREGSVRCPQGSSHGFACGSLFRFRSNGQRVRDVKLFILKLEKNRGDTNTCTKQMHHDAGNPCVCECVWVCKWVYVCVCGHFHT